jgi:RNA polymerase sigma-70 factor (ECF subfamily)
MLDVSTRSALLQGWIDRLRAGDESARQGLLDCASQRLRQMARKMLRRYPRVRRWEETDDVLQNVSLRLYRTLEQVTPTSVRDFVRLASLNIRRELLDLVRHYYGPRGLGAHHAATPRPGGDTLAVDSSSSPERRQDREAAETDDPSRLEAWTELHSQAGQLPEDEREVFDLLWYQGLTQAEAAELLGVNERTVKRRWQAARLHLFDALRGEMPPAD